MRILALLLAPLPPALVAAFAAAVKMGGFESDTPAIVALGCLAAGYTAALVFGLPLSFLWHRFGFRGIVGGISLGIVSAIGVAGLTLPFVRLARVHDISVLQGFMNLLNFAIPLGTVGGLVFWWFGLRSSNNSLEGDAGDPRASG